MKSDHLLIPAVKITALVILSAVSPVSGQCPENKYGPGCSYDCHCDPYVTCDLQTGCGGRCAAAWDGPTCQRQNVALKRQTRQSSNYDRTSVSRLAVDGVLGHSFKDTPCTHTRYSYSQRQSWVVILDDMYWINRFTIYNRQERVGDRLKGFTLTVGNSSEGHRSCYQDTTKWYENIGAIVNGQCTGGPVLGDTIRIRSREGEILTLCEVLIYVCSPGWYSDMCDKRCVTMTECSGCDATGTRCQVCVPERYGETCQQSCSHCWNDKCDKETGECLQDSTNPRCDAGFWGTYCTTACKSGTYGPDCTESCGSCASGKYACNTTSGHCPGQPKCMPGYSGLTCQKVCDNGAWGADCVNQCGNCHNDAVCDKTNGDCPASQDDPRCTAGYRGNKCQKACYGGTYGPDCSADCGFCAEGRTVCDTTFGLCPDRPGQSRCMPGYFTEKCDAECQNNTWGEDCRRSCGNCYNATGCSKVSGECPVTGGNPRCSTGYLYTDVTCYTPCQAGLWGDNCSRQCSGRCGAEGCDLINGMCLTGCLDGCHEGQNKMIGGIVGGIIGLLVLCLLVAVILFRRRRHPSSKNGKLCESTTEERNGQDIQLVVKSHQSNTACEAEELAVHVNQEQPEALYENQMSTPVPVEEFWEHVKNKMASDGFKADFAKFPAGLHAKHEVANLPHNKLKSRYKDLVAYDHSRVVLQQLETNEQSDYINASYIDGYKEPKKFIASQGPTDLIINDFMRMLWEQDAGKVVMLTNLIEDSKKKCNQYWPSEGSTRFGDIEVTIVDTELYANYTIRTLVLSHTKVNDKTKLVKQFHFTTWPDHGAPSDATVLLDFRDKVLEYRSTLSGPTVVHCSAGIGRTGTFIALDYLINQAKEEGVVDVPASVMSLRQDRVNMVQTQEQYEFLHEALGEALKLSDSSIPSVNFAAIYSDLCTVDPETGESKMAEQFEILQELSKPVDKIKVESARHPDNISKNRYTRVLAADNCRPYLSTPVSGCNDYINAVFLPGYKRKRGFILTQTPLPNTVLDFWRLVYDHDIHTIIMLDSVNKGDKNVGVFWTDQVASFGPFDVEVTDVEQTDQFSSWTYALTYKDKKAHQSIKHFRCPFWPNEPTLNTIPTLLCVLESAVIWQGQTAGGPVLVLCRDGATKSGLFCVAWSVLERLKVDQNVNIVQTVKQMRSNRPEIITDLNQLNFIHQVVMGYLESFQTYANFHQERQSFAMELSE